MLIIMKGLLDIVVAVLVALTQVLMVALHTAVLLLVIVAMVEIY
jgi:hypothetical protein